MIKACRQEKTKGDNKVKKLTIGIIVLLIMIFANTVYADEDYFTMEHYTDPTAIASVGGDVTLTVKISHDYNSAYVMSNVEIYKDSYLIISFGDIYAGQEVTKSGNLNVSAGETDGVVLTLKYSESGQRQVVKDFTVTFSEIEETKPEITFSCNLSKTTGESEDTVTLTYKVENVGSVHIYDLKIEDTAFGTIKELAVLKTGQNTQAVYTSKINEGFISKPQITYTVGDVTYKESLDSVEVTAGNPGLDLLVTANKSVIAPGDNVTVSFSVSSPGTSDLDSVVISENKLGELFTIDGLVAGETQTLNYDIVVDENTTLNITAVGDNGSEKEWLVEKTLDLVVDESLEALDITIEATASETVLEFPGIVVFDILIENTGSEIYRDLIVTDKDSQVVNEITQLVTGISQFQVNVNVSESATYYFTVSIPNEAGNTQYVSTTPIEVTVQSSEDAGSEQADEPENNFTPTEFDNDSSEPFANSRLLVFAIIILALILFSAIATLMRRIRR